MASDTEKPRTTSRRDLLIGGLALATVAGGWQVWARLPRSFDFADIDGLPGWRRLDFDGVSRGAGGLSGGAFLGIDAGSAPDRIAPDRLCAALFGTPRPGRVPVAVFSDAFCPYCRTLVPRIAALADDPATGIDVTWHELPLLGPASVLAARATLAADMQNGYSGYQSRLLATPFRPTTRYFADAANAEGLRPGQLLVDMDGEVVASRLSRARAAAATLGIYGTPALVVGRTLVMGEITDREFKRLVALEAGRSDGCA